MSNHSDHPTRVAAFFDVDGTLVDATIVHYYAYFATRALSPLRRRLWLAGFIPKILYYIFLDRVSRSAFNRIFYQNYAGMDARQVRVWSQAHFEDVIRPRLYPDAITRVAQHRDRGERVVLVTGSLDFIMQPVAEFLQADALLAVQMTEQDGRLTGHLTGPPIGDEEKAHVIRAFADTHHLDLARSFAYGDSRADIPMLRCVGHPVVINPKRLLRRVAEENGWGIENWEKE
ncbi:MAG: HAD family hydrolase [Candidatus Latescibacteria bacterium]|nr:HAD family hydrolase [Candidatus Latescibacterota bacterium]